MLGYLIAVAMPLIGLLLGIVIAVRVKDQPKQGALIIVLSLIALVMWVLIITSGALSTTGNNY